MVTIAEAKTELKSLEAQAKSREKEISTAQSAFGELKQRGRLTEQLGLAGDVGRGGVGFELTRRRRAVAGERRRGFREIGLARAELASFRGQLASRRADIAAAEEERARRETERQERERTAAIAEKRGAAGFFDVPKSQRRAFGEQVRAQRAREKFITDVKAQRELAPAITTPISVTITQPIAPVDLPSVPRKETISDFRVPFRDVPVSPFGRTQELLGAIEFGADVGARGETFIPVTPREAGVPGAGETTVGGRIIGEEQPRLPTITPPPIAPPSFVSLGVPSFGRLPDPSLEIGMGPRFAEPLAPEPAGEFGGFAVVPVEETRITKLRRRIRERGGPIAEQFVIPPLQIAQLGAGLFVAPRETVTQLGVGLRETGRRLVSGEGFPGVGQLAREEPLAFSARVTSEVLTFRGLGRVARVGETGFELARARVSPGFRSIQTREIAQLGGVQERFITVPEIGGAGELGLIPAGGGPRAIGGISTPPSIRGGFGFSRAEQATLIGQRGPVATSARDLFGFGRGERIVESGEAGFGLFATPPIQGRAFTRISRLGTQQREATLGDIFSGDFTLRRQRPQIVVFPEQTIGRQFQPFGFPSSELEVTLPPGRLIRRTGQPAVIITGRRRVPIITAEIGETTRETSQLFRRGLAGDTLAPTELRRLRQATGFDLSRTLETRPFIPTRRFGGTFGISISRRLTPSTRVTGAAIGTSIFKQAPRRGEFTTTFVPTQRPPSSPDVFSPPVPGRRGLGPFVPGGFSGLPTPRITEGFGEPRRRRTTDRRRPKKKKARKRRGFRGSLAPSFTATALDLRGSLPREIKIGSREFGISPGQIRLVPQRRRKKN